MAQHIRPAQAFAAIAATTATGASAPEVDERNLHRRICDKMGSAVGIGTTQYGTLKTTNSTQRPIVIPATAYTAMVNAGVDFSDALYNSTSAEASESSTGNIP